MLVGTVPEARLATTTQKTLPGGLMDIIYLIGIVSPAGSSVASHYGYYRYRGAAQSKADELNKVAGYPQHQTVFYYEVLPVDARCKG